MDPEISGRSLCLFENIGISFCPGHGLGHSISYTLDGNFKEAFQAHFFGPAAVLILSFRIVYLWHHKIFNNKSNSTEN
ncbi:DUF2752 domain-containing protein [Balneola sp. MJW-20]|uniref:DUF2752 domain-containing protein n=1 Tax=Gracilimonas aurantiaca TaxID=3234185 RepID=UPI003465898E